MPANERPETQHCRLSTLPSSPLSIKACITPFEMLVHPDKGIVPAKSKQTATRQLNKLYAPLNFAVFIRANP
jgi:hypothetical protein